MNPRLINIRAICVFSCLLAQITMYSASTVANESAITVKMDNKTIFIPEVKLTRKVTPVASFLYIGSWKEKNKGKNIQKSLCELDSANDEILIHSPDALLENSKTRVVTRSNVDPFLDKMFWGQNQATHIVFKVMSDRRQPAVIETSSNSDIVLFHNGNLAGSVPANNALVAGGHEFLPVMLEKGVNFINIKQYSNGKPCLQMSICLDHSHDLTAAWQARGGLLAKLVITPKDRVEVPIVKWSPYLGSFSVALEVRDVSANTILLQREALRQGKVSGDGGVNFSPGIYEAVYQSKNESASEYFVVGDPREQFEKLQDALSKYNTDRPMKLNIKAQVRRGQILLSRKNYDFNDEAWQEKITYTLGCLASIRSKLAEGVTNFAKDQPGLHIRGFASKADDSAQFYRLFVPSNYNPGAQLPLLVVAPTRIVHRKRPFIKGPVLANHREALHWAYYAEKYGFAVLWPGYRSVPEGNSCESMCIEEAIQAVEKDYNIDKGRISVYGSCGAGYNAGRLVSEFPNRFAAIVYDRAVFNLRTVNGELSPSSKTWREATNPAKHALGNRNLKIFVMNDNTRRPGHGEMELTTKFLEQAKATRNDVVSYLDNQPMDASRMDKIFSWLAPCRNEHPDDMRSNVAAKSGYTGPISEVFTTPLLIVEGTHAIGNNLKNIQNVAASLKRNYKQRFHGAQCAIKKDVEVTQDDISSHSLILIGNSRSNSVWEKLQTDIPINMTPSKVLYKNATLTGNNAFEAIVRHPYATDKYILMIGAGDLRYLQRVATKSLFTAWYDCIILTSPHVICAKLEDMNH